MDKALLEKATQLADLILSVDTDYRGDLLYSAGEMLRDDAQGYTGQLLKQAGAVYGIHNELHPDHK